MFYPGFYFDSTYLLLVPAIIIAFWAQLKIDNAYKKYKNVRTASGVTGSEVARSIFCLLYTSRCV